MRRIRDKFVELIDRLHPLGPQHVLEIGCGTGHYSEQLAMRCRHLTAVDPSSANLQSAHARGIPNADFLAMRAQDLGRLGGRRFDMTVFTLSLHHLMPCDMSRAIHQAVDHTTPGGLIIFLEPGYQGSFFEAELAFNACDGDERAAKKAAQETIKYHPRLSLDLTLHDDTAFRFEGMQDFIETMHPAQYKERADKERLSRFLGRNRLVLTAQRRIDICRPLHMAPAFLSAR